MAYRGGLGGEFAGPVTEKASALSWVAAATCSLFPKTSARPCSVERAFEIWFWWLTFAQLDHEDEEQHDDHQGKTGKIRSAPFPRHQNQHDDADGRPPVEGVWVVRAAPKDPQDQHDEDTSRGEERQHAADEWQDGSVALSPQIEPRARPFDPRDFLIHDGRFRLVGTVSRLARHRARPCVLAEPLSGRKTTYGLPPLLRTQLASDSTGLLSMPSIPLLKPVADSRHRSDWSACLAARPHRRQHRRRARAFRASGATPDRPRSSSRAWPKAPSTATPSPRTSSASPTSASPRARSTRH